MDVLVKIQKAMTEITRIKEDAFEKMTDAKDKSEIVQREIHAIKALTIKIIKGKCEYYKIRDKRLDTVIRDFLKG
jgi:hypothetical protein